MFLSLSHHGDDARSALAHEYDARRVLGDSGSNSPLVDVTPLRVRNSFFRYSSCGFAQKQAFHRNYLLLKTGESGESGDSSPTALEGELFGKPLHALWEDGQWDIETSSIDGCPYRFMRDIQLHLTYAAHLSEIQTVEIFRKTPNQKLVEVLLEVLDLGEEFPLEQWSESGEGFSVHEMVGVYKMFLFTLPEPLLTEDLYVHWNTLAKDIGEKLAGDSGMIDDDVISKGADVQEFFERIGRLVTRLPTPNRGLLRCVMKFLRVVGSHSEVNRMTFRELAMIFASALLRPSDAEIQNMGQEDVDDIVRLVEVMIQYANALYE